MTTNKEYKEQVEKKFGKPLKEIMYELCVTKNVVPTEGASILEVPKSTFNYWRNYYRFGPLQRKIDMGEEFREKDISNYKNELKDKKFDRDFKYKEKQSLDGLKEMVERLLELEKYKRTMVEQNSFDDFNITMRIYSLESTLDYINKYTSGNLYHQFINELSSLKEEK